jgi:NAD(P)-dependent dehydrogenase (short-subunit alcohol dehydrogenase family)
MNVTLKELDGKTALVTGSTSGIGKATAAALARLGATVIVTGRDTERGARVVKEIEDDGGAARFVAADLSDPGQVAHLAHEAGAVDILVNNAGRSWFGPTADLDAAAFDALFSSNVRSAYLLTAALAPAMAAARSTPTGPPPR